MDCRGAVTKFILEANCQVCLGWFNMVLGLNVKICVGFGPGGLSRLLGKRGAEFNPRRGML